METVPVENAVEIPITKLIENPNNARKVFKNIEEFASSMKQNPDLPFPPILVRPKGDKFEIVYGHRRTRASKVAGRMTVTAIVRDLTDEDARLAATLENGQREALTTLEEADEYAQLKKDFNWNAEQIALKVGKSKATVHARLKLAELGEDGRTGFAAGMFDASTALLISRLPKAMQGKALDAIEEHYGDEPPTYREAEQLLGREVMKYLNNTAWKLDDDKLVPAAGACTKCPKNSANIPDMASKGKRADVCTDAICFNGKLAALFQIRAKGRTILTRDQVRAHDASGHVKLSDEAYDLPHHPKWSDVIKGELPPVPVVVGPDYDGHPVEFVSRALAMKAAKNKGLTTRPVSKEEQKYRAEKVKAAAKDAAVQKELVTLVVVGARKAPPVGWFWRTLFDAMLSWGILDATHAFDGILEALGVPLKKGGDPVEALEAFAKTADEAVVRAMVTALVTANADKPLADVLKLARTQYSAPAVVKALAPAKAPPVKAATKTKPAVKAKPVVKAKPKAAAKAKKPAKSKGKK